ncbi:hypothetical protein DFA_02599 [Cavenderia fasciculata]|uniref:Uncharacterized protein n=1 Tax=Cavenderia fasciculata TaxID=261658 RepID=F4PZU6_CACFS|nr:uncharacterized protein DFA_02599 [Cavenderia fasciculata]EGG18860.1 hypothetical protein DFA_02599 [Cavenderia fasciculata]|eukprot:XP_004357322.1 hypothetical protein DFA_02599 [Cavenderia fasciculata]
MSRLQPGGAGGFTKPKPFIPPPPSPAPPKGNIFTLGGLDP